MASGPTVSSSTASTATATATICSYQSEWKIQDKQINALHEEVTEA
jgi:hypothetical protein